MGRLPYGIIEASRIVTSQITGDWCLIPYPGHPKGCPKYNREGCPPDAPFISEIMDLCRPVYIAFSEFDLYAHVEKLRLKHPKWSDRKLKCVLYWQETSRRQMRQRAKIAQYCVGGNIILTCPEAHGVNVYATCLSSGLRLEKIRRIKTCRHIALIGYRLDKKE